MDLRTLLALCRQAVTAWIADYAPSMGAAIAYYTVPYDVLNRLLLFPQAIQSVL